MKNLKDVLMGKGVYLIAIVCVALVVTVGLYISNLDRGENNDPVIENGATDNDRDVIAVPGDSSTPKGTPAITDSSTTPLPTPGNATPAATAAHEVIKMVMPVEGEILVDYAMDKLVFNKTLQEWRTHAGVDIGGKFGDPVKAAADGKVVDVKTDPRLGCLVIVEHSKGLKSVYANLKDEYAVKIDQTVKQGDLLGWIGRTAPFEFAEETHVHFEVLYNDSPVNPWNYLPER